ncbi:MAG TPA: dynamin family protein [Actinophytocola sp.]|uniref:dynamin family protein n=1 Tax=Actinophytocola sp. TaxID=1872138 RepID=UPI002DDD4DC5|nr:dynamin family protein [Actinophytocola sp.]HEV2783763.1 dynamin family protein [Actinophytocola sp.]
MTTPVQAVELALSAVERYHRPDLESRLRQAKARLLDDQVRVLVVGEFKQGKSMLVNALVGAPVCPVFDDISTSVPTVVRYADEPAATAVRSVDPTRQRTERVPIPVERLADYASETGNPGNRERLSHVEVGIPRSLLAGGLELIDTPGVGGLSSVHGAATMSALPSADAVLLVSDASQEYTAPELDFLRQAIAVCPNVACVLTKTDLYPEWRTIAERDRKHLAAAGIDAPMFTVSTTMRWHALESGDGELNTESGYPALVQYLRKDVLGRAGELARRSTAHDVLAVTEAIAGPLRAEQSAQQNPEKVQELIGRLTEAERRATQLKERSARWQQTLSDGVADLNADIDYDLRDRLREIIREAEAALDAGGDPTKTWPQFSAWVQQAAASTASANFLWATQRARRLAQRVAEHFDEERSQVLPALRTEPSDPLRSVRSLTVREGEKFTIGRRMLTGLKGGYMGMLMFGMLGTLVGFTLLNPISIGAGLLLGGKSIGEERKRIITRKQTEAKAALRRYIDDVTFHVAKDSRDMLRGVQRDLRDHFTALAEQMKRSLQESLQAAEKSVKASKSERDARLAEIAAELRRLEAVGQQARGLLSPGNPGAAA